METCPEGFRCGHCVANDKAKREAAREAVAQRIAVGEAAVGQVFGGLGGVVRQTYPVVGLAQARTFTREEVLTILRAQRAVSGGEPGEEAALNRLHRIFERIE